MRQHGPPLNPRHAYIKASAGVVIQLNHLTVGLWKDGHFNAK